MKSFITYDSESDFSIYNIPFGVAFIAEEYPTCVTRIGDTVIDLAMLYDAGYLDNLGLEENVFEAMVLNPFIELGKSVTVPVREHIQKLFLEGSDLSKDTDLQANAFFDLNDVQMMLPVHVPNYTDFYSSIEHATNVGKMFRDPENALLPNWRHLPVGYHGRSSSIVSSGTALHRPKGQTKPADSDMPVFGPSKRLDFELEMAFITNTYTELGDSVTTENAEDHIFGMVLFNDWSARDLQKWEYVPLGPFLAKNFGSSVSPWIVTLEALDPFRVAGPKQDPEVLPYLKYEGEKNFDINLQVGLTPQDSEETVVCNSNFKYMYWNMAQQLAHHTVNGCNIEVGDMYASGTISGKDENSYGSMLEISWSGQKPVKLKDGQERSFIEDYDTVTMRGWSEKDGKRVGFGEVVTQILPAK
ncbi:fumarylacetoacetase [Weeksellaceae bacterium KMM 9713]|uniref:fumarylacetoacetase n=1 Tax=Profundicola chukchiensis TaxID=2961959 RepID=A0A9X4RWI4_9FLAO|nr:fumarylacetoacetase [Profundicola chukchiensis]MDG4945807.1 fumarylacetoacetase [Profundicola chukchiensis]